MSSLIPAITKCRRTPCMRCLRVCAGHVSCTHASIMPHGARTHHTAVQQRLQLLGVACVATRTINTQLHTRAHTPSVNTTASQHYTPQHYTHIIAVSTQKGTGVKRGHGDKPDAKAKSSHTDVQRSHTHTHARLVTLQCRLLPPTREQATSHCCASNAHCCPCGSLRQNGHALARLSAILHSGSSRAHASNASGRSAGGVRPQRCQRHPELR